jgi:hypothetical protein
MISIMMTLSKAPPSQIDPSITPKLREMVEKGFTADDVKAVLDEIVHGGLASGFAVSTLDAVWKETLKAEGRPIPEMTVTRL